MIDYKKFFENFSSLTFIQVYGLLLPFIIYPYLIRVSGVNAYGELVLYQSYTMFLIITVSYGFDIAGTKLIASSTSSSVIEKLSSILQAKFILAIISSIIYIFLFFLNIVGELRFFISFLFLIISEVVNLNWFFLAIEKAKISLVVNVVVKTFFTFLTYISINKSDDLWLYPLFLSFGNIMIGIILLYIACNIYDKKLKASNVKVTTALIKDSFAFYFSRLMVVFRERFSSILIGLYLGPSELAFYDMCQKILNLLVTPVGILNNAIFPIVSRLKYFNLVKISIIICLIYSFFAILFLFLFSDEIIILILKNDELLADSYLIKISSVIIVSQVFIYFLGNTYLVIKGRKREFNNSIIYSTVLYVIFMLAAVYMGELNLFVSIIGFILCYSMIACHRIYISFKIHYEKI